MQKVWLVSKTVDMLNGARVSMVVKAYSSPGAAQEFVRACQGETGALVSATLVSMTPQGPQPLGKGSLMCQAVGVAAVQYSVNEVEVHGAIEAPPSRLVVPS